MPSRAIVTGIILVIMIALLVFLAEFFLPLSMKADMDMLCRNTLLRMETAGGLSAGERQGLLDGLSLKGFRNISIAGTERAKQGGVLNLHVEADYSYSKLLSLFNRTDVMQHMMYDRVAMARRVVN